MVRLFLFIATAICNYFDDTKKNIATLLSDMPNEAQPMTNEIIMVIIQELEEDHLYKKCLSISCNFHTVWVKCSFLVYIVNCDSFRLVSTVYPINRVDSYRHMKI